MIAPPRSSNSAMLNGESKIGIMNSSSRTRLVRGHDHEPPVDLLPPVHSGGVLLPDEAAFGEADPVQLGRVAFQPENVAEFGPAFGF